MSDSMAEAPRSSGVHLEAAFAEDLKELLRSLVREEVERAVATSSSRPRALSMKEAVEATSLSRSTLMRMERRGEVHFVRVGRRLMLAADEVERLINEGVER